MSNVADWARGAVRWETGLAIVVLLIVIVGSLASPDFLTSNNLFNLGLSNGEIAIMTLPMTLIIISGEIDLSVASILGLASALLGVLWSKGWPMPAVFAAVALTGLAAGAVNGLLITRLRLPSLAVTIGTLALYRGIATILLGPTTVSSFPAAYTNLGINAVPFTGNDITYSTAIFLVLALIFGVVLHATPFGRSIYAMGASAQAAQFAGIRVKRVKTILYMVSGLICSLAGVLYTFRLDTAVQNNGLGLELDKDVWPQMLDALRNAGWGNYSIFLAADGLLVGYLETDDYQAALARMAATGVNERWQAEMAGYFISDGPPDQSFLRLDEIFHLD